MRTHAVALQLTILHPVLDLTVANRIGMVGIDQREDGQASSPG